MVERVGEGQQQLESLLACLRRHLQRQHHHCCQRTDLEQSAVKKNYITLRTVTLKGHWTTSASASSPDFFKKVEIFIPLEVFTYVVTACLILLATST